MYLPLLNHINRYVSLEPGEVDILCASLTHHHVKKKAFLLKPGEICTGNYFISKGCMRSFFINSHEQDQITQFGIENWWITDYDSLTNQKPSNYYIQALEATDVIEIRRNIQEDLFVQIPKLERYFRLVLQRAYTASQRRIEFIYNLSGEDRYHQFVTSFPEFAQRVPQYMLASYLGFTPQFLSKIRAKR